MRMKPARVLLITLLNILLLIAIPAGAGVLVDVGWLKSHMNNRNLVIVDCQNRPDSYEKLHIPGAVKVLHHVDLEDPTRYPPNKFPQKAQFLALMNRLGIDNNTTVVAYDDRYSLFASRFLFIMELYGHDINKLKLLDGGLPAWKAAGGKVSTSLCNPVKRGAYLTTGPNPDMMVSWSDVYRKGVQLQDRKVLVHDTRPLAEFNGSRVRNVRGGHIPTAVNLESKKVCNNPDQTFKHAEQIQKAFTEAGITPDRIIYTYCHTSDRAAHTYVILKNILGYPDVRIYEGGWNEWGSLTALPAADEEYR